MLAGIFKLLRVKHWVKNLVVFVPLIFSLQIFDLELFMNSLKIFFSFCLISSTVYIFNDVIDVEKDRQHPIKCSRPIASGKISIKVACTLLVFLFLASIFLSKFSILGLGMILSYLILNIFYTFYLKNLQLIDATCIAMGFIFRIIAGCFVISVQPSPLIVLMTFFISLFFTFTKRKLEFNLNKQVANCRQSLVGFTEESLNQLVYSNAILAIAFYLIYMLDKTTIERCGTDLLYITAIPFTLIIYRLLFLINSAQNDDPITFFEKDKQLKCLIVVYIVILSFILLI